MKQCPLGPSHFTAMFKRHSLYYKNIKKVDILLVTCDAGLCIASCEYLISTDNEIDGQGLGSTLRACYVCL